MSATLATKAALARQRARILPEYSRVAYRSWWPFAVAAFVSVAVVLVLYTGFLVAVGGTRAITFVAVPIGIMGALCLWMLPDVKHASAPPFFKLVGAYLLSIAVWPTYIAIVIPGLPWLTPSRLVLAAMLLVMLAHLPQSAESRHRLKSVLGYDKLVVRLFLVYLAMEFLVLPLSPQPFTSMNYAVLHLFFDLAPMVAAAWVLYDIKVVPRLMELVCIGAIITLLIAVLENYMQQPPWMNYVPSFLQVDPSLAETYFSPQSRIGDNRYRIRSIFPIVLHYAQYVVVFMPVLVYQMWQMRGWKRILAVLLVPLLLHAVWFLNARTAVIGSLITVAGFGGLLVLRVLKNGRNRDGLKSGLIIGGVLLVFAMMAGVLATSHRAKMYTFGGSQHAASNDTRQLQWDITWSEVAKNPLGYGMGIALPSFPVSPTGQTIIDSHYINLLIGVGPIGFIGFIGALLRVIWIGMRSALRAETGLEGWSAALTLSVLNFVVSAYVISNDDSIFLVMVMAASILGIARAQDAARATRPLLPQPQPVAAPSRAVVVR